MFFSRISARKKTAQEKQKKKLTSLQKMLMMMIIGLIDMLSYIIFLSVV